MVCHITRVTSRYHYIAPDQWRRVNSQSVGKRDHFTINVIYSYENQKILRNMYFSRVENDTFNSSIIWDSILNARPVKSQCVLDLTETYAAMSTCRGEVHRSDSLESIVRVREIRYVGGLATAL